MRRSINDPQDLKAHVVCAPSETELAEMVQIAGIRWAVEVSFEDAKQETGLDEYEVRSFTGWYRHVTLSLFAYALLCVPKRDDREAVKKKQPARKGSLARFKEYRGLRPH